MKQFVSPEWGRPISQVSTMLKNPNLVLQPGENLVDLLSITFTAKVVNGPMFGTTAEIYDGNSEMIAVYCDSCGWFDVPTKDKTRFDTLELPAETTEGKKISSLDEMPEGLLHFYLNQCKVGAYLS